MHKEFSLKNKVVVITGAYGLIGKEVCDALSSYGAITILIDISPLKKLVSYSKKLIDKYKVKSAAYSLNILSVDKINEAIKSIIKKFNKIDVLINLAAIDAKFDNNIDKVPISSFENFPLDVWKDSINTNITGTFLITQAVIRTMLLRKSGNIINVASTYSLVAPNQDLYKDDEKVQKLFKPVDYVVSKSVIPNFTRYLATFYGNKGIRANTIVPHGVYNNHPEKFVNKFNRFSPLERMCDVDELRGPFIFLASDSSSYMTGSTLVVDGGWTAW